MKILLATKNKNKTIEIYEKFSNISGLSIIDLNEFHNAPKVPETGTSFEENALLKARAIAEFSGETTLADDSGLVVDALGGRPGIYSARYGGEGLSDRDRYLLLLDEMKDIPLSKRTARFVCSVVIYRPDKSHHAVRGECEGVIALSPAGDRGFGYDPVFYLPEYDLTMAELPLEKKNTISHRARALEKASLFLKSL